MVNTNIPPYSMDHSQREEFLSTHLSELMELHYRRCEPYRLREGSGGGRDSL